MPEWWTKRSLPPSSGVTKPKPLSSLNHLTVPVAMMMLLLADVNCVRARLMRRRRRALNTALAGRDRPTLSYSSYSAGDVQAIRRGPGGDAQPAQRPRHPEQRSGRRRRGHAPAAEDQHGRRGADARAHRQLAERDDGDQH